MLHQLPRIPNLFYLLLLFVFSFFLWPTEFPNAVKNDLLSQNADDHHALPHQKAICLEHATEAAHRFCSVSPYPDPITMEQPDGSTFQALMVVEEGMVYLETMDGYSVLKDAADDTYKYAVTGLDGDLFLSGATVSAIGERDLGEEFFLSVVTPHLRYTGLTKQRKKEKNEDLKRMDNPGPQGVFPPTGTQKALLILIDFPDQPQTYSVAEFNNLSNQVGYNVNGQSGSFRDYYLAVSYGLLTVNTDVVGWYRAANNRATYGIDDLNNRNFNNAVPLMREAVDLAEAAGIDFSQYDGDNDGAVDVVEIIHSGRGAEESANVSDIWSHRWVLSAASLSVTYDGVLINDYITQAEKLGATNIANIGVFVHEFGHALNLPDLYDADGGSSGLGSWCLMAGGTWNNGGKTPAHPSVWCKDQLGWVNKTTLTGSGTITNMNYANSSNVVYEMTTSNPNQYFLMENRFKTGWDTYLPGNGLLIFHIDESQGGNTNPANYKVNLEQADGNHDLNNDSNGGDTGDPYPGSAANTTFNCASTPNSDFYGGTDSNVSLTSISSSNNLISFDYGTCFVVCPNDDICDAVDITSNIGGADVVCTNVGATVQVGEPKPTNVGCNTQYSWCPEVNGGVIDNTVWFKFTAPASGSIDIDFTTAIDMQMALWEASTCSDLLDPTKRFMVAANDDSGTLGGYSPRIIQTCLVPGKEYFLQIDGFRNSVGTVTGEFSFSITDTGTPCSIAPTATGGCATNHTATSGGNGQWMHITDANGDVIASVNDKFNNLGNLTAHYAVHAGAIRTSSNIPYLNRDWQITPTTDGPACIRLYLTQQEFADLQAAGGPASLNSYFVSKVNGAACSDIGDFGTALAPQSTFSNFTTDRHMLQFDIDGFSSFFLSEFPCLNDNVCDAMDITANIGGNDVMCNNTRATVETNEPVPNSTGCETQNSWCESNLNNTVWFKFIAPASGSVDIDFTTPIDMQMSLWEANTCSDILDPTKRLMVAANDDSGTAGNYSPRITQSCLIPGKEYFLQIDGYFDSFGGSGVVGLFSFSITDLGIPCGVAPTATEGCGTDHTAISGGNGEWIHIIDANGDVIASVNDKFNNLGTLTANYAINGGAVRTLGNTPYLDRDWQITPQTNAPACVRLYLTQQEFTDLQAAGGPASLNDYLASKIEGVACSDFSTSGTTLSSSAHMANFVSGKHLLQFDVDGFSTFFAHGSISLPVELISFTGKVVESSNVLNWVTASEENTCTHVVERLNEKGDNWMTIGELTAANRSAEITTYDFEDKHPLLLSYYRIKTVDCNEATSYSDIVRLERTIKSFELMDVYPIPVSSLLNVSYAAPQSGQIRYLIRDITGRTVVQNTVSAAEGINNLSIDVNLLANGTYILVLQNNQEQLHRKFVKH